MSDEAFEAHQALVQHMRERQLLHRTLISHDAGWYHVGELHGGTFRPFSLIFRRFMPELRKAGLSAEASGASWLTTRATRSSPASRHSRLQPTSFEPATACPESPSAESP